MININVFFSVSRSLYHCTIRPTKNKQKTKPVVVNIPASLHTSSVCAGAIIDDHMNKCKSTESGGLGIPLQRNCNV